MNILHLTENQIPNLLLNDTVDKALQLMKEYKTSHLAVVSEEKFIGLIAENDLSSQSTTDKTIDHFKNDLIPASVNVNHHFLTAVHVANLYQTSNIPVINDANEYLGNIKTSDLLNTLGNFCGANENGALVVLEIEQSRLAISEINSIVESDGATILHLNISTVPASQLIQITIQINKREIATIISSFERYDYSISYYTGEELFENEISTNYQNLMNYLDI